MHYVDAPAFVVNAVKLRITRYPNSETRLAIYPERFPKVDIGDGTQPCRRVSIANEDGTNAPLFSSSPAPAPALGSPLDINFKVETGKRNRRGSLSRYGRRQILRAGSCFSQGEDTVRLLLTGTLPGSLREAFKVLADRSSYVTHRACNWLTRRCPAAKWMYTWEFQRRGALHLHLVVELPSAIAEFVSAEWKNQWNRLLNRIGNDAGIDMYAKTKTYSHTQDKTQADVTVCEREPSRYISKYIAKANAKGFTPNAFAPVRWYQISRSLLRELRQKTEVYEKEGLSYSQARTFAEDARSILDRYELSGSREFRGVVFAWSGYCYHPDFKIEEWGNNFMERAESVLHIRFVVQRLAAMAKRYPQVSCYMRGAGISDLMNRIKTGIATDVEMYWYMEKAIDACMVAYPNVNEKQPLAATLIATENWMVRKRGYGFLTDNFAVELNKICEDLLTG